MSSGISVTITGQQEVVIALQAMLDQLRDTINEQIQEAGIDTQADAKKACPVDTGRLRSSIQYTPDILEALVGTNVEYAPYVEMGHHTRSGSFVAAQPFLYPAFEKNAQVLKEKLESL